jgi:hypothetical protein
MHRPTPSSTAHAYRVPWIVSAESALWRTLTNVGPDVVTHVSTQYFGEGWMEPAVPRRTLAPGESIRLAFFGELARDTAQVCVHWRHRGVEYVWTFVG